MQSHSMRLERALELQGKIFNDTRFFYSESEQLTGLVREQERQGGEPAFIYPEVTGYACMALVSAFEADGSDALLRRAVEAAMWMLGIGNNIKGVPSPYASGLLRCRYYFDVDEMQPLGFAQGRIFPFDAAIALLGTLRVISALARQPRERAALRQRAVALGAVLLTLIEENGSLPGVVVHDRHRFHPVTLTDGNKWSSLPGAHHAKVAEALVALNSLVPDTRYILAARQICAYVRQQQLDNGRIVTHSDGSTHLHPSLYAADGLFAVGVALRDDDLIHAALEHVHWALTQDLASDLPAQKFGPDGVCSAPGKYRTDAIAQLVALASQLDQRGLLGSHARERLDVVAENLFALQDLATGILPNGWYEEGGGFVPAQTHCYWTQWFGFNALLQYLKAQVSRQAMVVVHAGGDGKRCWPISTHARPKPFSLAFLGTRSVVQDTVQRLASFAPPDRVFVTCSKDAQNWACKQLPELPSTNIVPDAGNLGGQWVALRDILETRRAPLAPVSLVINTTADNIFQPEGAFEFATLRAALASLHFGQPVVIGRRTKEHRQKFGHVVYRASNTDAVVTGFHIEKPKENPRQHDEDKLAWNVGTMVLSKVALERQFLNGTVNQPATFELKECLCALLSQSADFADLGSPGKDLHEYLLPTDKCRSQNVVVLAPNDATVSVRNCRNLLVIVDRPANGRTPRELQLVDLQDKIILQSDFAWAATCVPLDHPVEIEQLLAQVAVDTDYGQASGYLLGGMEVPPPLAHPDPRCTHGVVHLSRSVANVQFEANRSMIAFWGTKRVDLTPLERKLLLLSTDDAIVNHSLDVLCLGLIIARDMFVDGDKVLLRLLLVSHDLGGVLNEPGVQAEAEFLSGLGRVTRLGRVVDSSVVLTLVAKLKAVLQATANPTPKQRASLENLEAVGNDPPLDFLDDSPASARLVLECEEIVTDRYGLRDELLYLIANQDQATRFSADVLRRTLLREAPDQEQRLQLVQKCWAVLVLADQWVYLNTKDKRLLPSKAREDLASGFAFLDRAFARAQIDPERYYRAFNNARKEPALDDLTVRLRGGVAFLPSDQLLLALIDGQANDAKLDELLANAKSGCNWPGFKDHVAAVFRLPVVLAGMSSKALQGLGVTSSAILDLARRLRSRQSTAAGVATAQAALDELLL